MKLRGAVCLAFGLLASCSVVDTYSVDQDAVQPRQRSGTYFLPKHVVNVVVEVTWDRTKPAATRTYSLTTTTVAMPDPRQLKQVGFALSPFSDDEIKVTYTASGLLDAVSATATDRTGDILTRVAETAALLRAGTTVAGNTVKSSHTIQFDPYDDLQTRHANARLRDLTQSPSTCIEIERHPGDWTQDCPRGLSIATPSSDQAEPDPPNFEVSDSARKPGIYFRRPMPRMVHVVLRGKTLEMRQMMFANNTPIYRVDIKRTAFVARKTELDFDNGDLLSVSVTKPSEALAVATLPVAIVDAYFGQVVDMILRRKNVQDARAEYYLALATAINNGVKLDESRVARDTYFDRKDCLAAHPVDTTQCD
ncbi:MAG: hypothetical protein KL863_23940 [Rhizobium sp.]|nr:hypothetical protein [Rhizobium sp.]